MKIKKRVLSLLLLVMLITVAGMSAFFTDSETVENTFTIGEINIELTEPNWDEENAKSLTPNKTIAKDPKVTNIGKNDAFVMLMVEVPVATVKTVSDGNITEAKQELFSYTVNNGWSEVVSFDGHHDGTEGDVKTHVYAYVLPSAKSTMRAISPNEETATLFDQVKFANIVEGQGLEKSVLHINVIASAIQTVNLSSSLAKDVTEIMINHIQTVDAEG